MLKIKIELLEAMGAVKFDFLGVVALDKMWKAQGLINCCGTEEVLEEGLVDVTD